ncbi:Bmp family lipoprotein [Clostridium bornimense]|uniref:Bmp family lipoprotein n=1 Tax=Clostridium bornimense TaxID=1216932 RepID=W6RU57_9CLOT|nr:BMP family ABC transporter substrate-binding protein [Clostridium bornimense]CDM68146.1 Bmp family lipoprotein [Clostridium bornimense]
MKSKKIIAMLTAGIISMSIFTGCGREAKNDNTNKSDLISTDVTIGLSTDEGGLGDKSFNDAANKGLEEIKKEYNVKTQVLQSPSSTAYEQNIKELSDVNDLTFAIGFKMEDAMSRISSAKPDKKFAIVDTVIDNENVTSVLFKEHEGAFLMGVIAGSMTKTNKVGFVGGVDNNPVIERFEVGYIAGVKAVNPKAAEGLIGENGSKHGKYVRYAGTFGDPTKGTEFANQLYGEGVDIIFHAAASTGIGVINKASELREQGKDVWAIGVDQDQAVTMPQAKDAILSSCVKRVDVAIYNIAKNFINGEFAGGTTIEYGLAEDGIGIADTKDNLNEETLELVEKYRKEIIEGSITVPTTLEEIE